MRICLILEGCYPYVHGGVSTWMHQYIQEMKEHEFVLWVISASSDDRGKFVYELPPQVKEVHEVFLDLEPGQENGKKRFRNKRLSLSSEELAALKELIFGGAPDWPLLFDLSEAGASARRDF